MNPLPILVAFIASGPAEQIVRDSKEIAILQPFEHGGKIETTRFSNNADFDRRGMHSADSFLRITAIVERSESGPNGFVLLEVARTQRGMVVTGSSSALIPVEAVRKGLAAIESTLKDTLNWNIQQGESRSSTVELNEPTSTRQPFESPVRFEARAEGGVTRFAVVAYAPVQHGLLLGGHKYAQIFLDALKDAVKWVEDKLKLGKSQLPDLATPPEHY